MLFPFEISQCFPRYSKQTQTPCHSFVSWRSGLVPLTSSYAICFLNYYILITSLSPLPGLPFPLVFLLFNPDVTFSEIFLHLLSNVFLLLASILFRVLLITYHCLIFHISVTGISLYIYWKLHESRHLVYLVFQVYMTKSHTFHLLSMYLSNRLINFTDRLKNAYRIQ